MLNFKENEMAIARWYKIDFHTHTPKSNCFPNKKITAEMWLDAAKKSGLNAVVVTDHNSVEFIEEIEKVKNNFEVNNIEKKEVFKVFYGIELCVSAEFTHIILIFNDNMEVTAIQDAIIKLGLERKDWGNTEKNVSEANLEKLCKEYKNNILVIPAHFASNKGLGKCNQNAIKKYMEFVKFAAVEVRNDDVREYNNKLNNKCINKAALITGSDNPSDKDPTKHSIDGFGKVFTWIKVSEMSFNALQQVFIDPEHRCINWVELNKIGIDFNPNNISYKYISGMEFNGINHMNDMNIRFSPHLNCIVGGRGTGKSTIAEVINYGVGGEHDLTKCDLMNRTFSENGSISTYFNFGEIKSYRSIVTRQSAQTSLIVENDDGVVDDPPEFKIDFYGQKEIFGLIDNDNDINNCKTSPLIKLIDSKINTELYPFEDNINASIKKMLSLANDYKANQKKIQDMPKIKAEIEESEAILKSFQASGIEIARAEFEETDNITKKVLTGIQMINNVIEDSIKNFVTLNAVLNSELCLLNTILGEENEIGKLYENIQRTNLDIIEYMKNKNDSINSIKDDFNSSSIYKKRESDYKKYMDAVEAVNKTGVENIELTQAQLQINRNRYDELNKLKQQQKILKEEIRQSVGVFLDERLKLSEKRKEAVCNLGVKDIEIEIVPLGHVLRWRASLQKELGKEGTFDNEFKRLSEKILSTDNNFENYKKFIEFLLIDDSGKIENLYDIKMNQRFNKLWIDKNSNDTLSSVVKIIPEDKVNIKIIDKSGNISINDGSPGQKSAAMLAFILNSGDNPLIIDQPEDDLDNSLIYSLIVKSIRQMKEKRQIIIVTHNPNIPVLGDAEGILILDKDSSGKGIFRKNKKAGCIEEKIIREGICEIMEGGEFAFKKRKEKYLENI